MGWIMNLFKRLSLIFAVTLTLPFFQNCSGIDFGSGAGGSSDKSSQSSNGDGYSGMQVLYTKDIAAGEVSQIRVITGQGPFDFVRDDGGRGTLTVIENQQGYAVAEYRAPAVVTAPYVAELHITDANGAVETAWIRVGFDGFYFSTPASPRAGSVTDIQISGKFGPFTVTYADGGRGSLQEISNGVSNASLRYSSPAAVGNDYYLRLVAVDQQGNRRTVNLLIQK